MLSAWERDPIDYARCKKEGKSKRLCREENAENNARRFTSLLNADSYKVYNDFSPEEKERAMDYADGDQMPPDDAVAKVAAEAAYSED